MKEKWEKEFDNKFKVFKTKFKLSGKPTFALGFIRATPIKSFIKSQRQEAYKQGVKERGIFFGLYFGQE